MKDRKSITSWMQLAISRLLVCVVAVQLGISPLFAQSADLEGALIEHEVIRYGVVGETQVFETQVNDNVGVESVTLFHKISGTDSFRSAVMTETSTGFYQANVAITANAGDTLFYYIVAEDKAGNRSQKGLAFDPLERLLETREVVTLEQPPAENTTKGVNWVYVALGVLALGALAGAAAGGGGDPAGGSDSCGNTGCTFTLNLPSPQ